MHAVGLCNRHRSWASWDNEYRRLPPAVLTCFEDEWMMTLYLSTVMVTMVMEDMKTATHDTDLMNLWKETQKWEASYSSRNSDYG